MRTLFHDNGATIVRKLGPESSPHPLPLLQSREDAVFLDPSSATPLRDFPLWQMQKWIKADEKDAEKFWRKAKAGG